MGGKFTKRVHKHGGFLFIALRISGHGFFLQQDFAL